MRAILVLFVLGAFWDGARGQTNSTVSPSGFEVQNGNTAENVFSGLVPTYQQMFRGSSMAATWQTPVKITGIAFRVADGASESFDAVIRGIDIRLSTSTTTPEGMNSSYAANRGADELSVFSRQNLAIFAAGGLPQNPFQVEFQFDTPFVYDATQGNLLLYIANGGPAGTPTPNEQAIDAHSFGTLNNSVPFASVRAGSTASARGLVTEFRWVAVPEPSTTVLIALSLAVLLKFGRKSGQS